MKKKDNIKQLIEAIEKLSGKKVMLEEFGSEESPEANLAIDSIAGEVPAVVTTTAIETGTDLIPLSSLNEIKAFVLRLNEELEEGMTKLTNINPETMSQDSATDYYGIAEGMKDTLHKLARINQFVENSVKINKFDKDLLGKVLAA